VRTVLIAILICGTWAIELVSTAQDKVPPSKTDLAFDAREVPPPDPKRGKPVARVLDQYLYLDQLGGKLPRDDADARYKLQGLIFGPLLERVVKRESITATEQEMHRAAKFLDDAQRRLLPDLKPEGSPEQMTAAFREVGQELVLQWKTDRALYQRYGGPVIFQQGNPLEPVGAYRRFLEDVERGGAFEIHDPDHRKAFYDYFTRRHPGVVPKELINYDKPWWVRTEDQRSNGLRRAKQAERFNERKQTTQTK